MHVQIYKDHLTREKRNGTDNCKVNRTHLPRPCDAGVGDHGLLLDCRLSSSCCFFGTSCRHPHFSVFPYSEIPTREYQLVVISVHNAALSKIFAESFFYNCAEPIFRYNHQTICGYSLVV